MFRFASVAIALSKTTSCVGTYLAAERHGHCLGSLALYSQVGFGTFASLRLDDDSNTPRPRHATRLGPAQLKSSTQHHSGPQLYLVLFRRLLRTST